MLVSRQSSEIQAGKAKCKCNIRIQTELLKPGAQYAFNPNAVAMGWRKPSNACEMQ